MGGIFSSNPIINLDKLLFERDFSLVTKDETSMSRSIILKTTIDGKKCVMKLTNDSLPNDNSLEIERNIYELVKNELWLSPHFLSPLCIGSQKDTFIVAMKDPTKPQERLNALYEAWLFCRINLIHAQIKDDNVWVKLRQSLPNDLSIAEYMMFTNSQWKSLYRTVHYVITKEMNGEPLFKFLREKQNLTLSILQLIAIQVAQALTVLEFKRIMHNDLHFGNIFIETLNEPQTIYYHFPKITALKTNFVITIFDFDQGTTPKMYNKGLDSKCKISGQCNIPFLPKFDWYTFLSHLIAHCSHVPGIQIFQHKMLGDLYEPPAAKTVGLNSHFGLPCKCERVSSDGQKCEACTRFTEEDLKGVISPQLYFNQNTSVLNK
jgi:serine/threonine protein kinase